MIFTLHQVFAWVVVVANGVVGLWAGAAHWVEALRGRAVWVAVGIAQVLCFAQVTLGVMRLSQLGGEPPEFHVLYGFLTLVAVAILYGYRTQVAHIRYLVYGIGSLFIMGLAIRAMTLDATVVVT